MYFSNTLWLLKIFVAGHWRFRMDEIHNYWVVLTWQVMSSRYLKLGQLPEDNTFFQKVFENVCLVEFSSNIQSWWCSQLLPFATNLRQGNVFTPICHSVHRGGVCLSACWDTPPRHPPPTGQTKPLGRHPLGRPHWQTDTPWADTPRQTPLTPRHPPGRHPPGPPSPADGYCSGRYASYWNPFLLGLNLKISQSIQVRLQAPWKI